MLLPCARGNVRWRGCSQVCGFRRGWPGPRWASARDPLAEKGGPVGRAFFCYPGPGPSGPWPGPENVAARPVAVVAGPRRRLGAKPADGQGFGGARGSQGAPSGNRRPPPRAPPPAKAHRRACRPPAGIEVAKRGGSRRGRASAIRLFARNGRSTSHGLEPRGTRVWQFDPVDGIVYCGARGRRVSLLGGQVELDPLEDGGFRA